jgi:hypothetical protein
MVNGKIFRASCRPPVWTCETAINGRRTAPQSLFASGTVICRCGSERQSAGMSFIPAAHAQNFTSGRQKVSFAQSPFVNQAGSRAFDFFISQASLRLSNDVRQTALRQEQIGRNAKVPRQSPHMIEG